MSDERHVVAYNFHQPPVLFDLHRDFAAARRTVLQRHLTRGGSQRLHMPEALLYDVRNLFKSEVIAEPMFDGELLGALLARHHVLTSDPKRFKCVHPSGRIVSLSPIARDVEDDAGRLHVPIYLTNMSWVFGQTRIIDGARFVCPFSLWDECDLGSTHNKAANAVQRAFGVLSSKTKFMVSRRLLEVIKTANGGRCVGSACHPVTIRRHLDIGLNMDAAVERSMYYEVQVDLAFPVCGTNDYFAEQMLSMAPHAVGAATSVNGQLSTEFDVYLMRIFKGDHRNKSDRFNFHFSFRVNPMPHVLSCMPNSGKGPLPF